MQVKLFGASVDGKTPKRRTPLTLSVHRRDIEHRDTVPMSPVDTPRSSLQPVDAIEPAIKRVLKYNAADPERTYRCQRDRIRIPKVHAVYIISIAQYTVHLVTIQRNPIHFNQRLACHCTPQKVIYTSVIALSALFTAL